MQEAKKKNRKGSAMGGMVMGIKKELWEEGTRLEGGREGLMVGRVRLGDEGSGNIRKERRDGRVIRGAREMDG